MKYLILLLVVLISNRVNAQYWQQEVNYKIDVKLNDVTNTLTAFEEFEYVNNSPQALDFLYIHVWPNAYKDGSTALAKQKYSGGDGSLTFAKEVDRGWIDSLDFKVNGVSLKWEYDTKHIDIVKLYLNSSLAPGTRVKISTPFKVKIPSAEFSRLGHVGESFQITQWYPKPAVYDKNGWNQMPYLNQGEFYSEYGSFDVKITVPKNYLVAATGDLQTESEVAFLRQENENTKLNYTNNKYNFDKKDTMANRFPKSSTEWKTLHYKQSKVHDFAWFADKRFQVLMGEVKLPETGEMVTTYTMFTPKNAMRWKNSIEYMNDAIFYYSKWNGDYPYNQATAIDGTIAAGGGMEYPNVTVIGNSSSDMQLEIVIVHEVGHNWFYGILGSNERVHGWMDEGLNTLNEVRYVQTKYPENTEFSNMILNGAFNFHGLDHHDGADIQFRGVASLGADQPMETHSDKFTGANYGFIMYQKTGLVFDYLKDYLGDELFDKCMRDYYQTWKFKHPQPEDIRASIEKSCGKDLSWMFNDLVQTTNHIDYKIKSLKNDRNTTTVKVKNVGQVNGPIPVSIMDGDKIIATKWLEPGVKKGTLVFENSSTKATIDPLHNIPEIDRTNNSYDKSRLLNKVEPLKIKTLWGYNRPENSNMYWIPLMIGGNAYDKFMLGTTFHNLVLAPNKFNYIISPMYSFGRKSISGLADLQYTFLPKARLAFTRVGMSLRTFKNEITTRATDGVYSTVSPWVFMSIGERKNKSPYSSNLLFQMVYRADNLNATTTTRWGGIVRYNQALDLPDHNVRLSLRHDYVQNVGNNDEMARLSATGSYGYRYLKKGKSRWMVLRGFIGKNYTYNVAASSDQEPYSMGLTGENGVQDVMAQNVYFERSNSGAFAQQRMDNQGAFKISSNYGATTNWLATVNFYAELPYLPKFIGIFAEYGVFGSAIGTLTAYNAGMSINIKDVARIHFPLAYSKQFDATYPNKNYLTRIKIMLDLNFLNKGMKLKLG